MILPNKLYSSLLSLNKKINCPYIYCIMCPELQYLRTSKSFFCFILLCLEVKSTFIKLLVILFNLFNLIIVIIFILLIIQNQRRSL